MRSGLTARLLVAGGVLVVIVLGAFISLLLAMSDAESSRNILVNSQAELSIAREIRNLLIDMESGQRGFVITGDERVLEPWEAARQALPGKLAQLRQIADDPAQKGRAAQLERDALAYVNDYAVPLVDAARHRDPAVKDIVARDGQRLMGGLRREVDTYATTETSLILSEEADTRRAFRHATLIAATGLGVSVLVTALTAIYLARGVVRPIRRIARMAERLAGGDLTARVPQTATAEVGVLERAFNSMAQSLQRNRDELARLNDEQAALRRIATLVAHGRPPGEVFSAAAREVGVLLGAEITRLVRFEADGAGTVAAAWARRGPLPVGSRIPIDGIVAAPVRESGKPARIIEELPPELPPGSYSAVGAPIMVGGILWGAITALSPQDRALPDGSEARMAEFTDLVGTAIANAQDRADLVASRVRIVKAADYARHRLERDLHDGAQQQLVSLALQARMAHESVPDELVELKGDLAELASDIAATSVELREISRGIYPGILSEGGLPAAFKALGRRSHIPVSFDLSIEQSLPDAVAVAAYYVAAEALTNAAKHSHASEGSMSAAVQDGVLYLSIHDNGIGGADLGKGSGLVGLNDRVEAFGGHMTVTSPQGCGTTISVSIPVDAQPSD